MSMLNAYRHKKIVPKEMKKEVRLKKFHFPHLSITIEAVTYDEALTKAQKAKK